MFEDIESMEKEIEIFRQNMMASSGLVDGMKQFVLETAAQKKEIQEASEKIIDELQKCTVAVKNYQENAEAGIKVMMSDFHGKYDSLAEETKTKIKDITIEYENKLIDAEKSLEENLLKTEKSYQEFEKKIEKAKVEHLFDEVQSIKKSLNTKFTVLMSGMGALIVGILVKFFLG